MPGEPTKAEKTRHAQEIELIATFNKSSLKQVESQIEMVARKGAEIHFRLEDIEMTSGWAKKIRAVEDKAQGVLGAGLLSRYDKEVAATMNKLVEVRSKIAEAETANQTAEAKAQQMRELALEGELDKILDKIDKRTAGVQKMQEEWGGDPFSKKGMLKAGSGLKDGFIDALGQVKSGDLAGLAKSLVGGLGKVASAGSASKEMAAAASGSEAAATELGVAASSLAMAAAGIAAAAGAIAVVVKVLMMADEQAKEFNKSLMDGAGIGDFVFTNMSEGTQELTNTLDAARKASLDLALAWRGDAKEYAGLLAELNKSGMTYKKMATDISAAGDAQRGFEKAASDALVWSKALGMSASETADIMGQWSLDFGMDLDSISTQFAEITKYAATSSMGTKRFFTTVSQATAGMALYNIRMGEAAGLLAQTSKILGSTDASDLIKSLTKGFVDESYTERMKKTMIVGTDTVRKMMSDSADSAAKDFNENFGKNVDIRDTFDKALGKHIDISTFSDPKKLVALLGKMDKKQLGHLATVLRTSNQDAAARQVEAISETAKDADAGLSDLVKGQSQMTMGAKMTMKMIGLGGKHLNEMSGIELAAYEQYSGIGGQQLEQLKRLDQAFQEQWSDISDMAAAAKSGQTLSQDQLKELSDLGVHIDKQGNVLDASNKVLTDLNAYEEHAGDRQADDMKSVADIQDEASAYAESTMKNTTSVLSVLQTGIQVVLENIYEMMESFYNHFIGMSQEDMDAKDEALKQNKKGQENLRSDMGDLAIQLAKQQHIVQTKGTTSDEGKAALTAIDSLQKQMNQGQAKQDLLEQQGTAIAKMTGTTGFFQKLISGGTLAESGAGGIQARALTDLSEHMDNFGKLAEASGKTTQEVADAVNKANVAANQAAQESYNAPGAASGSDVVKGSEAFASTLDDTLGLTKDSYDASKDYYSDFETYKKWQDPAKTGGKTNAQLLDDYTTNFDKDSRDAVKKGVIDAQATQAAAALGLNPDDTAQFVSDVSTMSTKQLQQQYGSKVAQAGAGGNAAVNSLGLGTMSGATGGDFVMRPGQPPQLFSPSDTVLGMKGGGPLAAGGGAGGGNVHVHVYGGDQGKVYQTVKNALKSSGLRPGR